MEDILNQIQEPKEEIEEKIRQNVMTNGEKKIETAEDFIILKKNYVWAINTDHILFIKKFFILFRNLI